MKTLVLFKQATDPRPVIVSSFTELTYQTNMLLMDKWQQQFPILCGKDKVLDETFYAVQVYGINYHAPTLEALYEELAYDQLAVVTPFQY